MPGSLLEGPFAPALGEHFGLGLDPGTTKKGHPHPSCEVTKARVTPMAVPWGQSSLLTPSCCPPPSLATGRGRGQLPESSWTWAKPGCWACDNLEPMILRPEGLLQALCWCVPGRLCCHLLSDTLAVMLSSVPGVHIPKDQIPKNKPPKRLPYAFCVLGNFTEDLRDHGKPTASYLLHGPPRLLYIK